MFSTAPLNTAALNSAAAVSEVQLSAVGGVSVSATAEVQRVRGFRATAPIAVFAVAATFARLLRSSVAVRVFSTSRMSTLRGLSAMAAISVGGSASLPSVVDLAADALISVDSLAILGGKLLESQVSLTVTAAADPTRLRVLGATPTLSVGQSSNLARLAGLSALGTLARVTSTPVDLDVTRDGVRIAGLSAHPIVSVLAAAEMLRTVGLGANPAISISTSAHVTRLRPLPSIAAVSVTAGGTLGIRRPDGGAGDIRVTAQAALRRIAGLGAAAPIRVQTNAPALVLLPAALRSEASIRVAAELSGFDRIRGLVSSVAVSLSATAELDVRTPTLFAAVADVRVTSAAALSIARDWSGAGAIRVTAIGSMVTNLFDDEPDYRTLVVVSDVSSLGVPAQQFQAFISSDAQPAIVFTQPVQDRHAYEIDFTEWFEDLEGDDIEAASIDVLNQVPGAPQLLAEAIRIGEVSLGVRVWISGGADKARYKLTLTADTEGGRRKTVDFYVRTKDSSMITFAKQPADRLAYDFDFTDWFADLGGDSLAALPAATVEVVSASGGGTLNDLVVDQPIRINELNRLKVWIEGGVDGARYRLRLTAPTLAGRIKTVDFYLRVKEL